MTIKIGEKIKELRKKANVNQERFAEYLGITAQAVSRWEVEGCYPDIEHLPSIANYFNISIDELMCFDNIKNENKIARIIEQAGPERCQNWVNGSMIEIFRNAVREFPNNYHLLYSLAKTLCFSKEPYVFFSDDERQNNLRESITLCTRILGDCTDDTLRLSSLQVLAHAYKDMGEQEKAVRTASKLPLARDSRDMVLPEILDGKDKSHQIVQNIWMLSDVFESLILNLANSTHKNDSEKRITLFKKLIGIEEVMHENSDYIHENLRLRAACFWIAEDYMNLKEYNAALDYIERFAEHSIKFDALPDASTYTSVLYQNEICHKNKDFGDYTDTALGAKELLLSREIFAPVRGHERFKATICKLENHVQ